MLISIFSCRMVLVFFMLAMILVFCKCVYVEKDLVSLLHVKNICVIFLQFFLFSCFVICEMGVKHHSPLGGKRCLGEGVSWAHACS